MPVSRPRSTTLVSFRLMPSSLEEVVIKFPGQKICPVVVQVQSVIPQAVGIRRCICCREVIIEAEELDVVLVRYLPHHIAV